MRLLAVNEWFAIYEQSEKRARHKTPMTRRNDLDSLLWIKSAKQLLAFLEEIESDDAAFMEEVPALTEWGKEPLSSLPRILQAEQDVGFRLYTPLEDSIGKTLNTKKYKKKYEYLDRTFQMDIAKHPESFKFVNVSALLSLRDSLRSILICAAIAMEKVPVEKYITPASIDDIEAYAATRNGALTDEDMAAISRARTMVASGMSLYSCNYINIGHAALLDSSAYEVAYSDVWTSPVFIGIYNPDEFFELARKSFVLDTLRLLNVSSDGQYTFDEGSKLFVKQDGKLSSELREEALTVIKSGRIKVCRHCGLPMTTNDSRRESCSRDCSGAEPVFTIDNAK